MGQVGLSELRRAWGVEMDQVYLNRLRVLKWVKGA